MFESDISLEVAGDYDPTFMFYDQIKRKFVFHGITRNNVGVYKLSLTLSCEGYPNLRNTYQLTV